MPVNIIAVVVISVVALIISIVRKSIERDIDGDYNINNYPALKDDGFNNIIGTNMNKHLDYYVPPKPKHKPHTPELDAFWTKVDAEISHREVEKKSNTVMKSYKSPLSQSTERGGSAMSKPKITKKTFQLITRQEKQTKMEAQTPESSTRLTEYPEEGRVQTPRLKVTSFIDQQSFPQQPNHIEIDINQPPVNPTPDKFIDTPSEESTESVPAVDTQSIQLEPNLNKDLPEEKEYTECETQQSKQAIPQEVPETENDRKESQTLPSTTKAIHLNEINLLKLIDDSASRNTFIEYGFFDNKYEIPIEISSQLVATDDEIITLVKKLKGYGMLVDMQEDGIFGYPFKKKLVLSTIGKGRLE